MKIYIRHLEKVKEGVLVYGLASNIPKVQLPDYISGDTEEDKKAKNDKWKDELKIFNAKAEEVNLLPLNKAELIQKGE